MESARSYLTREGWQRDSYQTKEDLGNVVSALKNSRTVSALENEAGRVATGAIAAMAVMSVIGGTAFTKLANYANNPDDEFFYGTVGISAVISGLYAAWILGRSIGRDR